MMNLPELTQEDIDAIDVAGARGEKRTNGMTTLRKLAIGGLVGAMIFTTCSYFNLHVF